MKNVLRIFILCLRIIGFLPGLTGAAISDSHGGRKRLSGPVQTAAQLRSQHRAKGGGIIHTRPI